MAHRLKTREGKQLYALRKQTVEPVFGIIKAVLGFRQFLRRGLEAVRQEWTMVCLAWNFKRMAVLRLQGGWNGKSGEIPPQKPPRCAPTLRGAALRGPRTDRRPPVLPGLHRERGGALRVISLRKANRREVRSYAEKTSSAD